MALDQSYPPVYRGEIDPSFFNKAQVAANLVTLHVR
jgi:hypothetical protein